MPTWATAVHRPKQKTQEGSHLTRSRTHRNEHTHHTHHMYHRHTPHTHHTHKHTAHHTHTVQGLLWESKVSKRKLLRAARPPPLLVPCRPWPVRHSTDSPERVYFTEEPPGSQSLSAPGCALANHLLEAPGVVTPGATRRRALRCAESRGEVGEPRANTVPDQLLCHLV